MGRVSKNYLYNIIYQMLVIITPLITAPYLTRVLGATKLGIYGFVNSSGSIITTVALLGIYTYGTRQIAYYRDNVNDRTKIFWEVEIGRLLLGLFGTILYVVYIGFNYQYSVYFLIYYPYILAQFIDCSWVYVGLEEMKPTVLKNFCSRVICVCSIFLFVKSENDLWIYILMQATAVLFANLSIYIQLRKYIEKPIFDLKKVWYHIAESIKLFLPQVASLFYLQVDKIMLVKLTDNIEQLSFYDQAEKIITIPMTFITVLSTVMMPRIANEHKKNNVEQVQKWIIKIGKYSLFGAFPMMIGLMGISKQFVPWYLGSAYLPTAYAVMILAPLVVINSLASLAGNQYFTATNQIAILSKAYILAACVNVAVNGVLIPNYGYAGAAVATVFSNCCSVVTQYFFMCKQIRIKEIVGSGAKYAFCAVLMGGIIFLVSRSLDATIWTTAMQICIGALSYFILLVLIRDKTMHEILSSVRKRVR